MPWRALLASVLLCSVTILLLGGLLYLLVSMAMQPVQLMLIMLELAMRGEVTS